MLDERVEVSAIRESDPVAVEVILSCAWWAADAAAVAAALSSRRTVPEYLLTFTSRLYADPRMDEDEAEEGGAQAAARTKSGGSRALCHFLGYWKLHSF